MTRKELKELQGLHAQYEALFPITPANPWDQRVYEEFVKELLRHADDLIGLAVKKYNTRF